MKLADPVAVVKGFFKDPPDFWGGERTAFLVGDREAFLVGDRVAFFVGDSGAVIRNFDVVILLFWVPSVDLIFEASRSLEDTFVGFHALDVADVLDSAGDVTVSAAFGMNDFCIDLTLAATDGLLLLDSFNDCFVLEAFHDETAEVDFACVEPPLINGEDSTTDDFSCSFSHGFVAPVDFRVTRSDFKPLLLEGALWFMAVSLRYKLANDDSRVRIV